MEFDYSSRQPITGSPAGHDSVVWLSTNSVLDSSVDSGFSPQVRQIGRLLILPAVHKFETLFARHIVRLFIGEVLEG